ncbi:MAG: hypothetical protein HY672_00065 [Chloroflexi bacterium]|nr:hypothetical protein [Chloroflexota bacterium]
MKMSTWRRKWVFLLSFLFLLAVQPTYAQVPPPSVELVGSFCTMAQWKSGRILSTYDIIEDTYGVSLTAAQGLNLSGLQAPNIATWRARIRALIDKVCSASDVQAAQKAMEELGAAQAEIMKETQTAMEGVKKVIDGGKAALDLRVQEQMKPFVEEARTRNEQETNALRERLLKEGETPNTLTAEEQQQLKSFVDQKKLETDALLKAKGQEIGGPQMDRLKAVGKPFAALKNKLDVHKSASEAEWPGIRALFVAKQKDVILKDIDSKIAEMKARLEQQAQGLTQEQQNQQGISNLLASISGARATLELSLVTALEARNQQGIRQAVDTFWGSWAMALCTSAAGGLQTAREQAVKAQGQLSAISEQTAKLQEAATALSTLIQKIDQAQQKCSTTGTTASPGTSKELGETLKSVQQAAVEAKKAVEALKAP